MLLPSAIGFRLSVPWHPVSCCRVRPSIDAGKDPIFADIRRPTDLLAIRMLDRFPQKKSALEHVGPETKSGDCHRDFFNAFRALQPAETYQPRTCLQGDLRGPQQEFADVFGLHGQDPVKIRQLEILADAGRSFHPPVAHRGQTVDAEAKARPGHL